ncbi:MAG: OmpH family outer membrane protein [Cyclobacteriaceae bacterium]|jgi:outer membrane protein|nr:OmpH family outer membrane protein [Cytophagales bacterium]MCZ8328787.1 OmpH family outer membrane protein [Cyclobacteriaceae bacterium]
MKNLSIGLNVALLIAVAVLYYLHFASPSSKTNSAGNNGVLLQDAKIAFINADSVLKYYSFLEVNKKALEAKGSKLEQDFRDRAQSLQNDVNQYQRTVNNMTFGQAKAAEEDLAKKQQNLQMYQQRLQQELAIEEGKLNRELYERITKFLKGYASQNNLQVVLKYDPTSDVLFGGETLDITQAVIDGLNTEYKNEKEGNVKSDTTKVK